MKTQKLKSKRKCNHFPSIDGKVIFCLRCGNKIGKIIKIKK
jgi:hypothetical protein